MTAFEIHLGRPIRPSERITEREWYIKQCLTKEQQLSRQKLIRGEPKQTQLTLWT